MRQTRKQWIDLFAGYNARVELVYLEPPLATLLGQNERRPRPVPRKVLDRLVEKLEPPTWAEAHSLAFVS
jgi:predicted kinase